MEQMRDLHHSPFDRVRLGEPCHILLRRSWPLMVAGLTLESEVGRVPELPRQHLAAIPGWAALRGLLVHGVALRDRLAEPASAEVDSVHTVSELVAWIDGQGDEWWRSLLAEAAGRGWAFYCQAADSAAEAARRREAWPKGPEEAGWWADRRLYDRRVRLQALLWETTEAELEPILASREAALGVLAQVLAPAAGLIDSRMPRLGRSERRLAPDLGRAFFEATGRPIEGLEPEELASVRQLVVVPTPGLAREDAVSVARTPRRWTLWVEGDELDQGVFTVDVGRVLAVLGDDLNRKILESLVAAGPGHALLLAERLPAHPSTLSRHLNAMADAGVLRVRPQGHKVVYHVNPGALAALTGWVAQLTSAGQDESLAQ